MNEELLKRLDALALKFGVLGNQLWATLVHQARLEAIQDVFLTVFFGGLTLVCAWACKKMYQTDNVELGVFIATMIFGLIFFFVAICCVTDIPTELFNPDYWALTHLKDLLK